MFVNQLLLIMIKEKFQMKYCVISFHLKKMVFFYCKGRILPTKKVNAVCEMPTIMEDLNSSTFCVPVIYKHSTLAYNLINQIHWHSHGAQHSGVETVWRYVLRLEYVVKNIRTKT